MNAPVLSEVVNEAVPVGLEPPVSVAVQVVVDPTVNDGQETAVVGVSFPTVTVVVPGVPALLFASPE